MSLLALKRHVFENGFAKTLPTSRNITAARNDLISLRTRLGALRDLFFNNSL